MRAANISLPYFDILLDRLSKGDPIVRKAFGRHVHWGYWENPADADGSVEDFAIATETLCQRVYETTKIRDYDRLLDVGCGFGGTIASLNEKFQNLSITGLNIDARQLARARRQIHPLANNKITFVEGDACQLPFENNSMDVVLAVECIFHFPSREVFFKEVQRVLKPGGRFGISDFVATPVFKLSQYLLNMFVDPLMSGTYGRVDSNFTLSDYRALAQKTGLKLITSEDITRQTLPTYPVVQQIFQQAGVAKAARDTAAVEKITQLGLLRYMLFSFELQKKQGNRNR